MTKCKNCWKAIIEKEIGDGELRVKGWVHKKIDMTFEQLCDPDFDTTKVCMEPEPHRKMS